MDPSNMRILLIGAGVLGCNIAANLYHAGKDITVLARRKWYDELRQNGLRIKNKFVPGLKKYPVKTISELKEDDIYDVIIVSVRFTHLSSVIDLLNKNSSVNIIFNGNNTRVNETVNALPGKNVMFSFSLSAGKREPQYVNSIDLKKITIGDVNGRNNRELVKCLFSDTEYIVVYQPNMKDYLLSHAAFVVPVSFACYHTDGDLKRIRKDNAYLEQITRANIECYEALEKLNIEILPEEDKSFNTKKWFRKVMLFYKLMCSTSLGKLCASDHAMSAVDEMQALASDMKELINKAGIDSPNFDSAWMDIYKFI